MPTTVTPETQLDTEQSCPAAAAVYENKLLALLLVHPDSSDG